MHYRFIILLVMSLVTPQLACGGVQSSSSGGYRIQLEDVHGNHLRSYTHGRATYVLGQYGARYNIRVFNQTNQRVEAVVTVDGRDAISGATGDYVTQRGYVIDPYDSVLVEGFRRSLSQIAAFRFTNPADSYAGRRGTAQNVGVIGVAIFKERRRHAYRKRSKRMARGSYGRQEPIPGREYGAANDARSSAAPAMKRRHLPNGGSLHAHEYENTQNLGTRFGENRRSNAVEVPFKRASSRHPSRVIAVYYDDRAGLASRGIYLRHFHGEPNPFPHRNFAPSPY